MRTGYRDLDALIGEFSPGDLVIVGGRSGTGRSAFTLDTALYAARQGEMAVIYSFDTNLVRVWLHLASMLTTVPLSRILAGDLTKEERFRLIRSENHPVWSRLRIAGSANTTVAGIRERVGHLSRDRARKGMYPVSLVVVDRLRLMGSVLPVSEEARRLELGANIVQLKQMARDLRVTVLLVNDLHPSAYDEPSEPPVLSDLEPPEVAESYADKILLLHRGVSADGSGSEGTLEVIVAKQRNGRTGKVRLA
jgi:replicative DNA helicase